MNKKQKEMEDEENDLIDCDGDNEENCEPQNLIDSPIDLYVKTFQRMGKLVLFGLTPFKVSYVQNKRLIYVHCENHLLLNRELEQDLSDLFDDLPFLRERDVQKNVAACMRHKDKCIRVFIDEVFDHFVVLIALDYGFPIYLEKEKVVENVRYIPYKFDYPPNLNVCRLPHSNDTVPHFDETLIIRDILPQGSPIKMKLNVSKTSKNKSAPFSVDILSQYDENCISVLKDWIKELRVRHPCFDVVRYNPGNVRFLSFNFDKFHHEYHWCPQTFLKGNLSYFTNSDF